MPRNPDPPVTRILDAMCRVQGIKSSHVPSPTFFLAGAPKAGTTSLFRYLARHPDVAVARVKEPCYFAAYRVLNNKVAQVGAKGSVLFLYSGV